MQTHMHCVCEIDLIFIWGHVWQVQRKKWIFIFIPQWKITFGKRLYKEKEGPSALFFCQIFSHAMEVEVQPTPGAQDFLLRGKNDTSTEVAKRAIMYLEIFS